MGNTQGALALEGGLSGAQLRPKRVLSRVERGSSEVLQKWLDQHGNSALWLPLNFDGDTVWHIATRFKTTALENLLATATQALADPAVRSDALTALKTQPPEEFRAQPEQQQVAAVLSMLLSRQNSSGETPLHTAVGLGREETVGLLVAKGADPWAPDTGGGRTPLHYAAYKAPGCVHAIMRNAPPHTLARHAPDGSTTLRLIDVKTQGGFTPLQYAVMYKLPTCVAAILTYQPNLHSANSNHGWAMPGSAPPGCTALHIAAWKGYADMCRMILMHWLDNPTPHPLTSTLVDPRLDQDCRGRTPKDFASMRGFSVLMRLLDPAITDIRVLSPRLDSLPVDEMSLAAIAGTALRLKLQASVAAAKQAVEAARAAAAAAAAAAGQQAITAASAGHHAPGASPGLQAPQRLSGSGADGSILASKVLAAASQSTGRTPGLVQDGSMHGPGGSLKRASSGRTRGASKQRSPGGSQHGPSGLLHRGLLQSVTAVAGAGNSGVGGAAGSNHVLRRASSTGAGGLHGRKHSCDSSLSLGSAHKDPTRCDSACGVCWDAQAKLSIDGCGHGVCTACAARLAEGVKKRPLACPFCRGTVRDFLPRVASAVTPPSARPSHVGTPNSSCSHVQQGEGGAVSLYHVGSLDLGGVQGL